MSADRREPPLVLSPYERGFLAALIDECRICLACDRGLPETTLATAAKNLAEQSGIMASRYSSGIATTGADWEKLLQLSREALDAVAAMPQQTPHKKKPKAKGRPVSR